MASIRLYLRLLRRIMIRWIEPNVRLFLSTRLPLVWVLSLAVGVLVAVAAILFRVGIGVVQLAWIGTMSESPIEAIAAQPWWVVLLAPTVGGLIVGVVLQWLQPKQRTGAVADVIEARARGGRGLPLWAGLSSAGLTVLSLGSGASAGREGPVVHLDATLGTAVCQLFRLPDS